MMDLSVSKRRSVDGSQTKQAKYGSRSYPTSDQDDSALPIVTAVAVDQYFKSGEVGKANDMGAVEVESVGRSRAWPRSLRDAVIRSFR